MKIASQMCFTHVLFETDNIQTFKAWNQPDNSPPRNYFQSVIEDCRANKPSFSVCELSFTKRIGNMAAYRLALANSCNEMFWMEDYPHQIASFVLADVNNIFSIGL